jgi:hypothetical protein
MLFGDVNYHIHAKPFRPFRITMADGASHEVRFREAFVLTPTYLIVGLLPNADGSTYERSVILDLFSITTIEPLPPAPAPVQGNGQAAS